MLKRVLAQYGDLGLFPVLGPELEFYLCQPDDSDPRGYSPYASQESPVYTVGEVADPRGTLSRMLEASVQFGLGAVAAAHEYGRSQYEINLRHSAALDSADRAFRFKHLVKEMAARDGLLATFMGSPSTATRGRDFTCTSRSATPMAATAPRTLLIRPGWPTRPATSSPA